MENINWDQYIIDKREEEYTKIRRDTFVKMSVKHYNKTCNCKKNNKTCDISGIVDLNKFSDIKYIKQIYDNGTLDSFYNIMQSVTQSLKSNTGKTFENIIEDIFKKCNIDYSSQVKLDDNHTVDFIIHDIIISCKTTLRERYRQDKYINYLDKYKKFKIVHITMDDKDEEDIVSVNKDTQNFSYWLNNIITQNKMKVLDLFCGCGGFSQGFKQAGFDIVAGIDIWNIAIDTYEKNHDHLALCKDLTKYTPEELEKDHNIKHIDVLIGGPPCQGFSNAGKRDLKDPRNSLFMEFKKFLDYYSPKMFIMENVMGILSMKNDESEKCIDIISTLLQENYNINICKLYASDFGVPQNRRRVLIFGIRKDMNILPYEPIVLLSKDDRKPVSTVLQDKKDVDTSYYLSKRALDGIKKKKERMKKEGKGFGAQMLKFDKPSYTIPARYWKDGYDALVMYSDDEIRRLTILELSRIQSFPDSYKFSGSKKEIIMQIGNAVACKFSYHMALHLKELLKSTPCEKELLKSTPCEKELLNSTPCEKELLNSTPCEKELLNSTPCEKEKSKLTVVKLKKMCKEKGLKGYSCLLKNGLIDLLEL
jgi:DNA (cytosine-5)-methyltransferase 1